MLAIIIVVIIITSLGLKSAFCWGWNTTRVSISQNFRVRSVQISALRWDLAQRTADRPWAPWQPDRFTSLFVLEQGQDATRKRSRTLLHGKKKCCSHPCKPQADTDSWLKRDSGGSGHAAPSVFFTHRLPRLLGLFQRVDEEVRKKSGCLNRGHRLRGRNLAIPGDRKLRKCFKREVIIQISGSWAESGAALGTAGPVGPHLRFFREEPLPAMLGFWVKFNWEKKI